MLNPQTVFFFDMVYATIHYFVFPQSQLVTNLAGIEVFRLADSYRCSPARPDLSSCLLFNDLELLCWSHYKRIVL